MNFSFYALCSAVVFCLNIGISLAQPNHQPMPMYTTDPCNRVGHATTPIPLSNAGGGYMEATVGGLEVLGNTHFIIQNVGSLDGYDIVINKKNATTGATLATARYNIGVQLTLGFNNSRVWGSWLNASLNRLYIVGNSGSDSYVMCLSTTTLNPVAGFGTNGVFIVESNAIGSGIVGTGVSNNFVVLSDKSDGSISMKEYTSSLTSVMNGTISIPAFTLKTSRASLKRGPNGRYYFCGSSINTSNVESPMLWDVYRNTGVNMYTINNSTQPTMSEVGTGAWRDFDFFIDATPTSPLIYQCDIIAVGNKTTDTGIYARYIINNSVNYYTADPSFTNQPGVPGISSAVNNSATDIRFTKCRVDANGYATVMGWHINTNSEGIRLGYLNPNGTTYTATYLTPNPGGCTIIHKGTGLLKDANGDFLISGCSTSDGYTAIKLSNSNCMPAFNLNGSSGTICQGVNGYINPNISTSNCSMRVEKITGSGNVTLYNGNPIALIVTPTATTTYIVTITNNYTGCSSTQQLTITVLPNNPAFSMSYNTTSPSYYQMWGMATDVGANSYAGFGFSWIVEEIDANNNTVFTFNNPSCWWYPLTQANNFRGVDCILNNYSGNQTIANCNVPTIGKFRYGRRYRITRGTWNSTCSWQTSSVIVQKFFIGLNGAVPVGDPAEITETPEHVRQMIAEMANAEFGLTAAAFSVFPNPNNGIFNVVCEGATGAEYEVYDMRGNLVRTIPALDGLEQEIDLSDLGKGVYYIQAEQLGERQVQKLVIQ